MSYDVCHDSMLQKIFIFFTFQHIVSILSIWPISSRNEIALSYTKRKSIFRSTDSRIFRISMSMNLCGKGVKEDEFSMKKFVSFSSISRISIEKWRGPTSLTAPGDSPWKAASSGVKIFHKNDGWHIQLLSTKSLGTYIW